MTRKRLPTNRKSITHKGTIHTPASVITCPKCGEVIETEPKDVAFYITVGLYDDDSPGELFVKVAKHGDTVKGLVSAWAVVVSIAIQHGVSLKDICEKGMYMRFEPSGFTNNPDIRTAHSIIDYICRYLLLTFKL